MLPLFIEHHAAALTRLIINNNNNIDCGARCFSAADSHFQRQNSSGSLTSIQDLRTRRNNIARTVEMSIIDGMRAESEINGNVGEREEEATVRGALNGLILDSDRLSGKAEETYGNGEDCEQRKKSNAWIILHTNGTLSDDSQNIMTENSDRISFKRRSRADKIIRITSRNSCSNISKSGGARQEVMKGGIGLGAIKRKRTPTRSLLHSPIVRKQYRRMDDNNSDISDTSTPSEDQTQLLRMRSMMSSDAGFAPTERSMFEDEVESSNTNLSNSQRMNAARTQNEIELSLQKQYCYKSLVYLLHKKGDKSENDKKANNFVCQLSLPGKYDCVPKGRKDTNSSSEANAKTTDALRKDSKENMGRSDSSTSSIYESLLQCLISSPVALVNLIRSQGYQSLLLHASREGNCQVLALLARANVNLNVRDEDGSSPLIFACDAGKAEATKLLLENGADIDGRDRLGRSALTYAMYRGRLDVVKLLLEYKCDAGLYDVDGCTPLMYGAARGTTECCEILLNSGLVEVDSKNKDGFTALVYALECGQVETGRLLLLYGARPDTRSTNGSTCLHWAATCGQVDSCRVLLELKAHGHETSQRDCRWQDMKDQEMPLVDVDARNNRGITPLMYATARGQIASTRLLLDHGANIHAKDSEGSTPLMYACYRGFSEIAIILLEHGAEYKATNLRGATPLMYAAARGKRETCLALLSWAEEQCKGDVEVMRLMRFSMISACDCKGFNAADWAMHGGHEQTKTLLQVAASGIPIKWTRQHAYLFPDSLKKKVQSVLLSMRRLNIPSDVVDTILENLVMKSIWSVPTNNSSFLSG